MGGWTRGAGSHTRSSGWASNLASGWFRPRGRSSATRQRPVGRRGGSGCRLLRVYSRDCSLTWGGGTTDGRGGGSSGVGGSGSGGGGMHDGCGGGSSGCGGSGASTGHGGGRGGAGGGSIHDGRGGGSGGVGGSCAFTGHGGGCGGGRTDGRGSERNDIRACVPVRRPGGGRGVQSSACCSSNPCFGGRGRRLVTRLQQPHEQRA